MGSLKDPKTWIPHINTKDCSKKICSIYCTKWCKYFILPSQPPQPPPPPPLVKDDLGGTTLSPVVIMIIALIGTFSLLIAYYVIISRYCKRNNEESSMLSSRVVVINQENHGLEMVVDGNDQELDDNSNHVPWLVLGKGLDEGLIKSITMCKYKKGDGLVLCTECTVCLGEFQEDESIRLLPKCSHPFHVHCIDTWLKTHSNCPLCRANVCFEVKNSTLNSHPPPPPPPPPPPVITSELEERDIGVHGRREVIGSKSVGYLCQTQASIAQLTFYNQAEELARQEVYYRNDGESSQNAYKENMC